MHGIIILQKIDEKCNVSVLGQNDPAGHAVYDKVIILPIACIVCVMLVSFRESNALILMSC